MQVLCKGVPDVSNVDELLIYSNTTGIMAAAASDMISKVLSDKNLLDELKKTLCKVSNMAWCHYTYPLGLPTSLLIAYFSPLLC